MTDRVANIGGIDVQAFESPAHLAATVIDDSGVVLAGSAIAINPEKVMRARKDPEVMSILQAATIRYADGAGVVWAMRRKGVPGDRVPGVEVWEALMERAANKGVPVFLRGAHPDVLERTVEKLRAEFPGINIAGQLDGYDQNGGDEFEHTLEETGAAVVAIAMGSPKQEKLIQKIRARCPDAFFMGVGGTFDCFVGEVDRAPEAWCRLNLEWLYRLLKQPSRIRRQWVLLPYVLLVLTGRI